MTHDPTLRLTVGGATGGEAALDAAGAVSDRVREVGPTGADVLEPLALATVDGRTALYASVDPPTAERLARAVERGRLPTDGALETVDHGGDPPRFDHPALATGRRRVLARCGWVDPTDADALRPGDPGTVERAVHDAELRGRGRGDGATLEDGTVAGTWSRARETDGDPVVVVNAAESDDGVAGDRLLLASDPALVLEGAVAAAEAVGATDVVVCCPETAALARARVEALAAAGDAGVDVDVVTAPAEFRVAEPTMVLESMEGADRIEARRRPPGPATYGLFGRPTVVHTPRTLAQVVLCAREGAVGAPEDPGTRLLTLTHEGARATVELPTDARLRDALPALGAPAFRFATVGGRFGGLTRSLDVPVAADALAAARLGAEGGVELHDEGSCAVAVAGERARFAREANCGRCVPCREGSKQLHELLRAVYDGSYDEGAITELGRTVRDTSLCAFGTAAARPVLTAVAEFGSEFRAHANGRCPAGACR